MFAITRNDSFGRNSDVFMNHFLLLSDKRVFVSVATNCLLITMAAASHKVIIKLAFLILLSQYYCCIRVEVDKSYCIDKDYDFQTLRLQTLNCREIDESSNIFGKFVIII